MSLVKNEFIKYEYEFSFKNSDCIKYEVVLNKKLDLVKGKESSDNEWTKLEYKKCPNCTLKSEEHEFCPVAINIEEIIELFKNRKSFEEVQVKISHTNRETVSKTELQNGLSSLIGIFMVSSGCPVLNKLKPMVRFHLPFATEIETKYRAITMYLFSQYFRLKNGDETDWELNGLRDIYQEIQIVNNSFCKRILDIKSNDASINAITILNCFAQLVTFAIDKDQFSELKEIFKEYL